MKISVLIIAYNEEKYIGECIKSILNQNQSPDEVVLLAHNCTDKTIEIAQGFPITVMPFNGARGLVYALLEGLNHVSGDIILWVVGKRVAEEGKVNKDTKRVLKITVAKQKPD